MAKADHSREAAPAAADANRLGQPGESRAARRAAARAAAAGGERPATSRFGAGWPRGGLLLKIVLGLGLGTLAVYWQVGRFEFVNLDDPAFISEDPVVQAGVTWHGLVYAFTAHPVGQCLPLTALSHMLCVELFGAGAGPHHLVNVGLHLANVLLLFAVLNRMTGRLWCSAVAAALFAWHPLHVESVAWVAERKDVLSGLFWLLATWGYLRYVERPGLGPYLWVVAFLALGLLAKAMLVTLPFTLLLLDFWPLGRLRDRSGPPVIPGLQERPGRPPRSLAWLLLEKVPLLGCALAASVLAFLGQKEANAVMSLGRLDFYDRAANALVSYARYLGKTFLPVDLAVFYPSRGSWASWKVAAAGLLLVVISLAVWRWRRRHPWGLVGWCWFLGTLVPVSGVAQVGWQAMADRFTYIPLIGIFVALTWGLAELAGDRAWLKKALPPVAGLALAACVGLAWQQTSRWRNSLSLFADALAKTKDNAVAQNQLGQALKHQARWEEAEVHLREAVRIAPHFARARANLAQLQLARGRLDEALQGFQSLVQEFPEVSLFHFTLGQVQMRLGQPKEAIAQWREALRLRPDTVSVLNNLALALATHPQAEVRDGTEAVRLARRACELTSYGQARELAALAAALAETGQFQDAIQAQHKAVALASRTGQRGLEAQLGQTLQLYQQGRPLRVVP